MTDAKPSNASVPRLVGINHVALEVGDIEEALAFYGRIFSFALRGRGKGRAFIELGDQNIRAIGPPNTRRPIANQCANIDRDANTPGPIGARPRLSGGDGIRAKAVKLGGLAPGVIWPPAPTRCAPAPAVTRLQSKRFKCQ